MKKLFLIISILMIITPSFAQRYRRQKDHSFSVFVDSPLFFRDADDTLYSTIINLNLEYFSKKKITYSIGLGQRYDYDARSYYTTLTAEINKLYGNSMHNLELGAGLLYEGFETLLILRLGYRLQYNNLLFRVAYTPTFCTELRYDYNERPYYYSFHNLSVSIGYRFL